jgi:hypothetical protein
MTWLSLARSAPGVMIEVLRHPERTVCRVAGHSWSWRTGALACTQCRWAPVAATNAILDGLDTLEGQCMIADELKKP